MKVILQIVDGPSKGRQIPMQSGERVRFGSGDIADVSIPSDPNLSAVHFEVQCGSDDCWVRDLSGSGGLVVNGESTTEVAITDGDEILAGQSRFSTVIKGRPKSAEPPEQEAPDGAEDDVESRPTAEELCKITRLKERSIELFQTEFTPEKYVDVLEQNGLYVDAIQILAYYLPKREAVWWCLRGVESVSVHSRSEQEDAALAATKEWLTDPSDQNRRAAMAIAEAMNMENAACYAAASAFYSEGSLSPEGMPEVVPAPTLSSQVVSATLGMVAADGDPATAKDRYLELIRLGKDVLSGDLPLPEPLELDA